MNTPFEGWDDAHIGRSWSGTRLEDQCPCPKEPCGLVAMKRAVPECTEHPLGSVKSIRQSHPAGECPSRTQPQCAAVYGGELWAPDRCRETAGHEQDYHVDRYGRSWRDGAA